MFFKDQSCGTVYEPSYANSEHTHSAHLTLSFPHHRKFGQKRTCKNTRSAILWNIFRFLGSDYIWYHLEIVTRVVLNSARTGEELKHLKVYFGIVHAIQKTIWVSDSDMEEGYDFFKTYFH